MHRLKAVVPMGAWLEGTAWMRLLPHAVRQRVIAEAYESIHAEKEVVAAKGESP